MKAIRYILSKNVNPHLEDIAGVDCCDLARQYGITDFPELNNCFRKP